MKIRIIKDLVKIADIGIQRKSVIFVEDSVGLKLIKSKKAELLE